jgi:uncharacterized membrane protein
MNQTRTQDISTKTRTASVPANGAAELPLRPRQAFGGGLLPKAGVVVMLLVFPLGVSLLTAGEEPHQPQYRFTEIPVPGPSFAYGINNHGTVTGSYTDPATGHVLSFVVERGVLTTGISVPGAAYTYLGPANNRDVESGNYGDLTHQRPVLYNIRHGTFTPLPEITGMPLNFANGINDAGRAVGVAYASGDSSNGGIGIGQNWIWDGEDYSFLTVPGAAGGASVGGINNRDQISGYYFADLVTPPHGFVMEGTDVTTLDVPGATYTIAAGINNQRVVAGTYLIAPHGHHGFLWFQGKFVTVDDNLPASAGTEWIGINDHRDVAGLYFDTTAHHLAHAVIGVRVGGDEDQEDGE